MKYVYRPRDSRLSTLDDLTRIVMFLSLFFLSVLFSSIPMQLIALVAILLTAVLAGVLRPALGFVRYILFLSALLLFTSVILAPGGQTVARLPLLSITLSPLLFSLSMFLRLASSVISVNLLLLAVDPDASVSFISRLGRKTAASLLVATRLMPVLANEGEEVLQAFEARGVSVREGKWRERARSASRMVFPMLYSTMDRSMAVAEAMEVRGFPSKWKRRGYHFSLRDVCQMVISAASLLLALILSFGGTGIEDYYSHPSIVVPWYALLLFALLTFPIVPLFVRWSGDTGKKSEVQLQY